MLHEIHQPTPDAPTDRIAFDAESFTHSKALDVLCLFVLSAMLSLWGLAGGPWLSDHEAIVAQGARQIRSGDGGVITRVGDTPFVRKPPLPFWLSTGTSALIDPGDLNLPVSPFAARLPSGIAAVLTTMLVYFLGRRMYGHPTGMMCGAVMATAAGTLFWSHNAAVEMILTFLCSSCMALFWLATEGERPRRVWTLLLYVAFGLAMLAKAPFPLAAVGLPLAVWWFVVLPLTESFAANSQAAPRSGLMQSMARQFIRLRELRPITGLLIFLAIFLPWPIYVYLHVPNVAQLWQLEFTARYTGALYGTNNPFWYYLPIAAAFTAPYTLSLPAALASPFQQMHEHQRKPLLFAFTWVVVITIFLSTSAFKVSRYWIVCVPGAALLLGPTLLRTFVAPREFSAGALRLAKGGVALLLVAGTMVGAHKMRRELPEAMSTYYAAALIVLIGAVAAALMFRPKRRVLSLVVLQITVAFAFAFGWDVLGLSNGVQRKVAELVAQLDAHHIGGEDRITWVRGRPNAQIIYYSGRNIRPLFDDSELSARREGRQGVSEELMNEGIERIQNRLESDQEEYFIIDTEAWEILCARLPVQPREVFRVKPKNAGDHRGGLLVFTNAWNTGEWEKVLGGAPERTAKRAEIMPPISSTDLMEAKWRSH